MLLTITAVSPEIEDFAIELQIESDATFADLHRLIRETCGWGAHKPSTFYVCDERWRREKRIPEKSFEDETMDEVELGDHLEDEGQRLQYVFDPDGKRGLLLEVSRIHFGKTIDEPFCRRRHGTPPPLSLIDEAEATEKKAIPSTAEILAQLNAAALNDLDDEEQEPTDEDLFEMDELDPEGFDFSEG